MARCTAGNKRLCIIQDARMNFALLNQKQKHPLVSLVFPPVSFQLPLNFSKIGREGIAGLFPGSLSFLLSGKKAAMPPLSHLWASRCLKEEVEGIQLGGDLFQS